jgi:hypothetical protein
MDGIGFCEAHHEPSNVGRFRRRRIPVMLRLIERRVFPQHRTSGLGRIILRRSRPDTVCIVRDPSPAGGLLFVANAYGLPEEFDLQMDDHGRRCIARWRRLDRVGVEFKSIAAA